MILGVQIGDDLGVLVLAGERQRRVAGQELLQAEDQDRDEEQRRDDDRDAAQEIAQHCANPRVAISA
jgi:hypothetical protein